MAEAVRDNPALSRFELDADGVTAIANYRLAGGVMTFTHTEVPSQARGGGIASRLIAGALAAARSRGLKVVAQCPFVSAYIERHPEFRDLLAQRVARWEEVSEVVVFLCSREASAITGSPVRADGGAVMAIT